MSEKSKGILAFASNTQNTDYQLIASHTLALASRVLDLPVHCVTNHRHSNWHNTRVDIDLKKTVPWNNFNRYQAWELSPFDQTLVIDVDYLVLTTRLLSLFDSSQDLLLCHRNTMLCQPVLPGVGLQPVWATVFYFRKTPATKVFFELVARIQRNWKYYSTLFGVRVPNFRNDYAFAMAEVIFSGHALSPSTHMPHGIVTVDQNLQALQINQDWLTVRTADRAIVLPRCDLHVMSKQWLQSSQLQQFTCAA